MLKAAISTKALAVAFALLGFQFVCFCCSWPIFSLGVPLVDTTGRTANDYSPGERAAFPEYKGTLWEAPEERYFGIVWKLDCAPGAVQADEGARRIGEWLCGSPLAAIFGVGGRLGLLPLLLLLTGVILAVAVIVRFGWALLLLLRSFVKAVIRLVTRAFVRGRAITFTAKQLQKKFRHAADFGIKGNYSRANAELFARAIRSHLKDPATQIIRGRYHGQDVIHAYNPVTGLNVIRTMGGEFVSGWKLSADQVGHLLRTGILGGG